MNYNILVINPGSTSTKLGIFLNTTETFSQNLRHDSSLLAKFDKIIDQLDYRLETIRDFLQTQNVTGNHFDAVVARGGLLRPVTGGTYNISKQMISDLETGRYGSHASNLGAILANQIAGEAGKPAYIVDPVVVDELAPVARITGRPEIEKRSVFHALNQKAVARRFSQSIGLQYEQLNLIVAHLGGGISVGCHSRGKVVEVNNALDGEGPFSPERAGTVQAMQFCDLILEQNWGRDKIAKALAGQGGLVAHLGTSDAREVEKRISGGDTRAALVYEAMIYQIARCIAAAATPVCGNVDYIVLTGGIAYSKTLTEKIEKYVKFIAPVVILPGEDELKALAEGAYRVLTGQEAAKEYL